MRRLLPFFFALAVALGGAASAYGQVGIGTQPNITQLQVVSSGAASVCGSGWTGPTSGLTHCWPMDNAHVSGTTIQDAIGSVNGTAGANVTAGTGPSGTANTARTYDGTTQPISLASSPTPGGQPLSVATWVNLTTGLGNDGDPRWVCFQGAGAIEIMFASSQAGPYVDVSMAAAGATETQFPVTPTLTTWHHAAMTYDGSSLLFYWDGVLTGGGSLGVGDGCDASTWTLGGRNAANRLWAGSQSTTVIYNRALSGTEITQLKNAF